MGFQPVPKGRTAISFNTDLVDSLLLAKRFDCLDTHTRQAGCLSYCTVDPTTRRLFNMVLAERRLDATLRGQGVVEAACRSASPRRC